MLHSSNLRPVKRVDLLLEAAARVRPRESFRLVILAGEGFAPFADDVRRLGLEGRVVVLERVPDIEEYLQAADLGLFASDSESFCLSILEAMCFGCPSVATRVGGIPEVVEDGISGLLVPPGDAAGLARAVEALIADPTRRAAMGAAARRARWTASRPTSSSPATRRSIGGSATPDPVGRPTADEAGSPSRCAASAGCPREGQPRANGPLPTTEGGRGRGPGGGLRSTGMTRPSGQGDDRASPGGKVRTRVGRDI